MSKTAGKLGETFMQISIEPLALTVLIIILSVLLIRVANLTMEKERKNYKINVTIVILSVSLRNKSIIPFILQNTLYFYG